MLLLLPPLLYVQHMWQLLRAYPFVLSLHRLLLVVVVAYMQHMQQLVRA
jgi:hypothetical protein